MRDEFDATPSFYKDNEAFEKYLANTSYYIGLQNNVIKLIGYAQPKKIVELGCATGATSIEIAKRYDKLDVLGLDMRDDVVKIAQQSALKENLDNVVFKTQDMLEFVKGQVDADFILLLYSFHHIIDPISNKISFLNDLYRNIRPGTFVCIAETFIPDNAESLSDSQKILRLWNIRKDEGFASTFWSSLSGIDQASVKLAEDIGKYCAENEYIAGELVAKRENEYLVQPAWLIDTCKKTGFTVVIDQPINIIEDRIVLLQK